MNNKLFIEKETFNGKICVCALSDANVEFFVKKQRRNEVIIQLDKPIKNYNLVLVFMIFIDKMKDNNSIQL